MSVKSSTRSSKKRKILEKKVNVDKMYQDDDVIKVQQKLLNEAEGHSMTALISERNKLPEFWNLKNVPISTLMEEEKLAPVTFYGAEAAAFLPSGDNDCWQSTPEGKTQHYDSMPGCAFNEDLSKNKAIQEWALNHLPCTQDQKKAIMDFLSYPPIPDDVKNLKDTEDLRKSMLYQKPSLTRQTYEKLKLEKKTEKTSGERTSVKNRDAPITISKTVHQCQVTDKSGGPSTTMEVHLVRPTKRP